MKFELQDDMIVLRPEEPVDRIQLEEIVRRYDGQHVIIHDLTIPDGIVGIPLTRKPE